MFEHSGVRLQYEAQNPRHLCRLKEARAYLGQRYARMSAQPFESTEERADMMVECVLAVCDLFDDLFGGGTANALFCGDIADFETAMAAYEALEKHADEEALKYSARMMKYMPEENRP